jgi:hypothetical protein
MPGFLKKTTMDSRNYLSLMRKSFVDKNIKRSNLNKTRKLNIPYLMMVKA